MLLASCLPIFIYPSGILFSTPDFCGHQSPITHSP